jgi:LysM domain
MSALSAIETAEFDEVGARPATPLRLVTPPGDEARAPVSQGPAGVSRRVAAQLQARPQAQARRQAGAAPLRLTRRGRIVVVLLAAVLATAAITVASMALSGAQAANHGRPGGGYAGMHQIVVQPGQTLWSIATAAEPSADPRQVIQEIQTANSMTGGTIQAGQLLWVPK